MESMSASLEAEQKAKGEALRVKKALEGEINELEIGLDHANKANSEGMKSVKRYQAQLKETIQLYEDEARSRSQIMEQVGISERKAAGLSGELEESKALLDSSDRSKRQLETEIADGRNAVNNMQVINGRDMTAKRGLEGAIHTVQAEVDAMLGAAKNAEEKAKKAMVDAAAWPMHPDYPGFWLPQELFILPGKLCGKSGGAMSHRLPLPVSRILPTGRGGAEAGR